jgi:hypothetical protein
MSGDEKKRVTLDFGDELETPPLAPPVDANTVKAATRAVGFRETPRSPEQSPPSEAKTGQTEQFATRLCADTIEALYAYADRHEITLLPANF